MPITMNFLSLLSFFILYFSASHGWAWGFGFKSSAASDHPVRGVDFRMQLVSGHLNFTNISGIQRDFSGIGSELQTSLYFFEAGKLQSGLFLSTRVMTWTGLDLQPGEYDDMQTFSVAPGIEIDWGSFYFQRALQNIEANSYYISSYSSGLQFSMQGSSTSFGFNYRFNHLGIGIGYTLTDFIVPGERLDLTTESRYTEKSYSLNIIYYIGVKPSKFYRELFKR